jgi:hypothetical protein
MQCSARKFLTSQALYGNQIAHPRWSKKRLVKESVELADMLIKELDKPRRKK